jgi:hypothetical protein
MRPFAETKPLNLQPPKLVRLHDYVGDLKNCANFHCNICWIRAPPRICEIYRLCDSSFYIVLYNIACFWQTYFSGNRVAVEPRVALTRMLTQTTRLDASRCLFGVSIVDVRMHYLRPDQEFPYPQNFSSYNGNFKPKKVLYNF